MIIIIYLLLHVANMLLLKKLAMDGISGHTILVFRGLGCMFCAISYAILKRHSLYPKDPQLQAKRLLVAGLGLSLTLLSYQFINASTINLLLKYDILFLLVMTLKRGQSISKFIVFLLGGLLLLILHITFFKADSESIVGHIIVILGTLIISVGFLLLNKSARKENIAVTTVIPGLSLTIAGILLFFANPNHSLNFSSHFMLLICGPIMYFIYFFTIKLYKRLSIVVTELLTYLSILMVIPLEINILSLNMDIHHLVSLAIIGLYTVTVYLMAVKQKKSF